MQLWSFQPSNFERAILHTQFWACNYETTILNMSVWSVRSCSSESTIIRTQLGSNILIIAMLIMQLWKCKSKCAILKQHLRSVKLGISDHSSHAVLNNSADPASCASWTCAYDLLSYEVQPAILIIDVSFAARSRQLITCSSDDLISWCSESWRTDVLDSWNVNQHMKWTLSTLSMKLHASTSDENYQPLIKSKLKIWIQMWGANENINVACIFMESRLILWLCW